MNEQIWKPRALSTFERRPIDWLWRPFIPLGFITTIAGDGEVGKSTAIYDVVARITTGDPMPQIGDEPEQVNKKGSVVILCKEDDPGRIIGPRLVAAGADIRRIKMIAVDGSRGKNDFELLGRLDNSIGDVESAICDLGDVMALLIDPITDFAGDISLYKEDQVRRLLGPIGRMAAKYNFAAINILHLIKDTKKKPRQRILGSVGLVNISRSVLMVGKSQSTNRRFLMMEKKNLWHETRSAAFTIQNFEGQPVVDWENEYADVDLEEVLAGKSNHITKQHEACLYLRKWLAEGALASTEIAALAREVGISFNTFKAAKKEIGVLSEKRKDGWYWGLPKAK